MKFLLFYFVISVVSSPKNTPEQIKQKKYASFLKKSLEQSLESNKCSLAFFYLYRLHFIGQFPEKHYKKQLELCSKKIFPFKTPTVINPQFKNKISSSYLKLNFKNRIFIPSGYWYIGWVPFLKDYGKRNFPDKNNVKLIKNQNFNFIKPIQLRGFYIDTVEISEKRFGKSDSSKPVTDITYYEAQKWCKKHGGSLPNENQWEASSRGVFNYRLFTWGETIPVTCFGNKKHTDYCENKLELLDVSSMNVRFMGSRVNEWVTPSNDRPVQSGYAIIKGRARKESFYWALTPARRIVKKSFKASNLGFRCVYLKRTSE